MNTSDFRYSAFLCAAMQNGLVGINSEVSYQLDHAPAAYGTDERAEGFTLATLVQDTLPPKKTANSPLKIA